MLGDFHCPFGKETRNQAIFSSLEGFLICLPTVIGSQAEFEVISLVQMGTPALSTGESPHRYCHPWVISIGGELEIVLD
jgi:hypothetical protein